MADIRVGALDHHDVTLAGIEAILEAAPGIRVVGTASDAISARRLISETKPNVFILNLDVPDEPGIGLARQIRELFPDTAVLATMEQPTPLLVPELLDLGVKGYISTRVSRRRLVADIQSVAAGESVFGPEAMAGLPASLEPLNSREVEVLDHVASGAPTVAVARALGVSPRTVEHYLTQVYTKLRVGGRVEAVARGQQLGIIAVPALRFPATRTSGIRKKKLRLSP